MSCPTTNSTVTLTPFESSPTPSLPPFLFSRSLLPRTNQGNSYRGLHPFEEEEVLLDNRESEVEEECCRESREITKRDQVVLSIIDEVLAILEEDISLSDDTASCSSDAPN